jgi:hypothetical protein
MDAIGRPREDEATPYYFKVIDLTTGDDPVAALQAQLTTALELWHQVSEEGSLHRYAPGKWSLRQVLNHLNDAERIMLGRALWFARGFDAPLPSYEQEPCVVAAEADDVDWRDHVAEFEAVRRASLAFLRNLPRAAWQRRGVASGNPFSVRALAWILVGHVEHHATIVRERYLTSMPGEGEEAWSAKRAYAV